MSIKDTHDLRFNTVLDQIEYDSGAEVWLPAAPPANSGSVASSSQSAVAANEGPVTLYTVTTAGMYEISYYVLVTTSGTGADAVGQLVFNYPDASGGNALYANMPSGINATLLGQGSAPAYMTPGVVTYTLGSAIFAGGLRLQISASVTKL